MALAEILAALRHEAEHEVARIGAERDASVAETMSFAHREAERAEAEAASGREALLATEAEVVRNRAALHVERRLQEEREAIYREILRRAGEQLSRHRDEPSYSGTLRALLSECFDAMPDAEVVMASERDVPLVAELLAGLEVNAEVEGSLNTWGGVDVRSSGGGFVRNTLEERLARSGARLRRRIGDVVTELRGEAVRR